MKTAPWRPSASLPLRAVEFLAGKALPYFFIALTDVLVAILMGQLLFGVVMKSSFWLMILASTIYLGVALGIGLLISTVSNPSWWPIRWPSW